MPSLPCNWHLVTTSRSADNAFREKHAPRHVWSAAPATQNDIGGVQTAAPATKMQRIFWKRGKSIAPATQSDFWHVMKHVGMSRSATPATRNDATLAGKLEKGHLLQHLP